MKAANWMTHLDLDVESPVWGHWLRGLSAHHSLVRYDERGCGLSDWDVKDFSFDDWVEDLLLVVDDVGLDRFPLLGISQGAAVAVAFAARYPERVSRLVLISSYSRGRMARSDTEAQRREAFLDLDIARVGWYRDDPSFRQVFTSQFLPDGSQQQWEAFNELQRLTTTPENAVEFLTTFGLIDVTGVAPRVRCPRCSSTRGATCASRSPWPRSSPPSSPAASWSRCPAATTSCCATSRRGRCSSTRWKASSSTSPVWDRRLVVISR